jgi:hypothetical protein
MFSGTNPPGCVGCSVTDDSGDIAETRFAENTDSAGTWSAPVVVPEPSSVVLTALGLLLLACTMRRRFPGSSGRSTS